jgi:hypothetical protein
MLAFNGEGECEQLINLVYERPALWNKRCREYASKQAQKRLLWNEIASECGKNGKYLLLLRKPIKPIQFSAETCKTAWSYLQKQYSIFSVKAAGASGTDAESVEIKWSWYPYLGFLNQNQPTYK